MKNKLKLLVAGILNIETIVNVPDYVLKEHIPLQLFPFHGINNYVSGSGYNIAKALHMLGDDVELLSLIGEDVQGEIILEELKKEGIKNDGVCCAMKETPLSMVLYGESNCKSSFCDLKDIQEKAYDIDIFKKKMADVSTVVLTNTNFCRPFLPAAKAAGKLIATDVQAIPDVHDDFNKEFMEYADILFVSNDNIEGSPTELLMSLRDTYKSQIIVVGCGEHGASIYVKQDNFIGSYAAVKTRSIVNKVGAGDALFSAFMHFYVKSADPYYSLKNALLFASYKIGTEGSSNGFLTEEQMNQFYHLIWK